jgi:hypothetical protein
MRGLDAYEADIGPCGWHKSLTSDKSNHFTFEDEFCPVCAGVERYSRIQADRDEKWRKQMGDNLPSSHPRPSDGRRTFTRLMSPDEVSARRASGSG